MTPARQDEPFRSGGGGVDVGIYFAVAAACSSQIAEWNASCSRGKPTRLVDSLAYVCEAQMLKRRRTRPKAHIELGCRTFNPA
jgi:hypothetical protein